MRNFLVALAIFLIIVVGLGVLLARFFNRDPTPSQTPGQTAQQQNFSDKTTKVRFVADGAIVNAENHRSIRITVNPTERLLEVIRGYNGEVMRAQSFTNDPAAFKEFLIALNSFGYTRVNPKAAKDEKGVCSNGLRYIYEATYSSGEPLKSWSSGCGTVSRLSGNAPGIQQLFRNQIPGYNKLVGDVNLTQP